MKPTAHDPATFDVIPVSEFWEVRDSMGRLICTRFSETPAIQIASVIAKENRPAKIRLLNTKGLVLREWDYPE